MSTTIAVTTLSLASFIQTNPGAAAYLFGGMMILIVSLIGVLYRWAIHDGSTIRRDIHELSEKLTTFQIENTESHSEIIAAHAEFRGKVTAQLDSVCRGMPNGKIDKILEKLDGLSRSAKSEGVTR